MKKKNSKKKYSYLEHIWIRSQGFALRIQEACRVYHLDVIFKERQCCQNVTTRPSTPAPWRIAWTQLINTVSDRATVWCGRFVARRWLAILCLSQACSMWWHVSCVNSLKPVIIGSGNDLSPMGRQAITWTNDDALSMGILGNILQWNLNQNAKILIKVNAY